MSQSQPYRRRAYRNTGSGGDAASGVPGNATIDRGAAIWGKTDPQCWHDFAAACLKAGALASIATSSDGGVLHTFILHGRDRHDNYSGNAEQAEHAWNYARDLFQRWGCIPRDTDGW